MKLYEIRAEIMSLVENYDIHDHEVMDQLEQLGLKLHEKLGNCCRLYRNLSAEAEAIESEESRLRARRKAVENRAEALKGYVAYNLTPGQDWEDDLFKLRWRKSEAVQIESEESLPGIYIKEMVVRTPVKDDIKRALKAGQEVPGARLEQRMNLQIR
jgi:NurA-like 5'-3' nuclease